MKTKIFKIYFLFIMIFSLCGCSTTEGEYVEQNVFSVMLNGSNQTLTFNEITFNISNKYIFQEVEKDDHFTYLIKDTNDNNAYLQGVLYNEENINQIKEYVKMEYELKNFTNSDWVLLNTIKNNLLDGSVLTTNFEIINLNNNEWVKFGGKNDKIYYVTATNNCAYFFTNNNFSDKQMEEILSTIYFADNTSISQELKRICSDYTLLEKIDIYKSFKKDITVGTNLLI